MVSGSRLLVGMPLMKNSDFHQAGEILGCCQVELKISAAAPSWGLALTYDHRALYRRASVPMSLGVHHHHQGLLPMNHLPDFNFVPWLESAGTAEERQGEQVKPCCSNPN